MEKKSKRLQMKILIILAASRLWKKMEDSKKNKTAEKLDAFRAFVELVI